MSNAPQIVVKKNEKRPRESHVRAASSSHEWISHLHEVWRIPRTERCPELMALTG